MPLNKGYLSAKRTKDADEAYTPAYAVEPIVKYINPSWVIWCPFDKDDSEFVKILKNKGGRVIHTHVDDGFDFIKDMPNFHYDVIISNPPYTIKDEVLEKCYKLGKPFALLLPLATLAGKRRYELFSKHGVQLLVFDARINFYANGHKEQVQKGISFATCYFCWKLLPEQIAMHRLPKN